MFQDMCVCFCYKANQKTERIKTFELSKFQILVNKRFKRTFSAALIQTGCFWEKVISHNKSDNVMTGHIIVSTISEGSNYPYFKIGSRNKRFNLND